MILRSATTALILVIISLVTNTSQGALVTSVILNGQFSDSNGNTYHAPNTPISVGGMPNPIDFTHGTTSQPVDFQATFLRTDVLGVDANGYCHYSDVIKIEYSSLFGSPFLSNEAHLTFSAPNAPVDEVIDYKKASLFSAGYILNPNTTLPAPFVSFYTQQGGLPLTNGAPNSAFFELNFSYTSATPCPEPSSVVLSSILLGIFGPVWRYKRRKRIVTA